MRPPVVVMDIDGVLADVRHRLHQLARTPKDWEAFFGAAEHDGLLDPGAELVHRAASTCGVVYLTGRPERLRAVTQAWLDRHHLPGGALLMRADGDRRPATAIKLHELRRLRREFDVVLLVDDDAAVIAAAQAAGFTAQLADWMERPGPGHGKRLSAQHALFSIDPIVAEPAKVTVLRNAQQREGRT